MVYICRKEFFSAAHRVYNPEWSDEHNTSVFGACANPNWHGHDFELEVKVKGRPDEISGYVIDLKVLSSIIKEEVISKVHQKNLNEDLEDLLGSKVPSCENLVIAFWKALAPRIYEASEGRAALHALVMKETEKNLVEYYGEEAEIKA